MLSLRSLAGGVLLFAVSAVAGMAQASPNAGDWKTWVISSGRAHGVAAPPGMGDTRDELDWVKNATREMDPGIVAQIKYWDAGPPSYRWMEMITRRQIAGQPVGSFFVRAYAYVALAMHDATIAAWKAKYEYRRARPSELDKKIEPRVAVPTSPSYPSDYAATAFAAAAVMSYLVPAEAAHFEMMAEDAGKSRLFAGVEYPTDYFAGRELGKRIAEQVIAKAKADGSDLPWTGSVPTGTCTWTGTNPGNVTAANWKPLLLTTPSEFRPAPPPACGSAEGQNEVAAVRNFPRALTSANFATNAKAFYWQTPEGVFPWALVHLNRFVLEDRLENDPPRAARIYALVGAAGFDAFIASQDGKFAYWYPRPAQVDTTIVPLFPAPNFPSYPSNHAIFSTSRAEVIAYLFPDRAAYIRALAKEAGDSRLWAGIHYPMDMRAGNEVGEKVAKKYIAWAESDGSK